MKALVIKDKNFRNNFAKKELNQTVVKYSFKELLNNKKFSLGLKQKMFNFLFLKTKKFLSKTKIVQRCILTGRSRSSLRMIGVSRIKLKELIKSNKISNISKNSW